MREASVVRYDRGLTDDSRGVERLEESNERRKRIGLITERGSPYRQRNLCRMFRRRNIPLASGPTAKPRRHTRDVGAIRPTLV